MTSPSPFLVALGAVALVAAAVGGVALYEKSARRQNPIIEKVPRLTEDESYLLTLAEQEGDLPRPGGALGQVWDQSVANGWLTRRGSLTRAGEARLAEEEGEEMRERYGEEAAEEHLRSRESTLVTTIHLTPKGREVAEQKVAEIERRAGVRLVLGLDADFVNVLSDDPATITKVVGLLGKRNVVSVVEPEGPRPS